MTTRESGDTPTVEILLAAYNAEQFIVPQLDSILNQSCPDFRLLISDGGSTDGTADILRAYELANPGRIKVYFAAKHLSAVENFNFLLQASSAPLLMFSDHDDVWFTDKVAVTMAKFRTAATDLPAHTPLLVFTDATVTDAGLQILAQSSLRWQNLSPQRLELRQLLLQNVPSGNTMLFNRELLRGILPLPAATVMHDHYLALAAAATGKIVFLDRPTLYYRQHGKNIFGAPRYSAGYFFRLWRNGTDKIRARLYANCRQAGALSRVLPPETDAAARELLAAAGRLPELGWWARRRILRRYRIAKNGFWRNFFTLFTI